MLFTAAMLFLFFFFCQNIQPFFVLNFDDGWRTFRIAEEDMNATKKLLFEQPIATPKSAVPSNLNKNTN